jgi:hypothetical protein
MVPIKVLHTELFCFSSLEIPFLEAYKVSQFDLALTVNQDIFKFDVSVDFLKMIMQVGNSLKNLISNLR